MHYLEKFLDFDTVEEGEKKLAEAVKLQRSMGGWLYSSILAEDCVEIQAKLESLRQEKDGRHVDQEGT
jgi:hypothetical protein